METYTKVATSIFFTVAQKNMKLEQKAALSLYVTPLTHIRILQLPLLHGLKLMTHVGKLPMQRANGDCLH